MAHVTYEIRTSRGAAVFRFDNEARARQELAAAARRIGVKLRLVRITQIEEELAA